MRTFSKSKLMACLQCPKRLWLEIHRPELEEVSAATQAAFAVGHTVGAVARQLYDPKGKGTLIDIGKEGIDGAIAGTKKLLNTAKPIFEAGFTANGALALADVLLPVRRNGKPQWRMVEVKASTAVKDYHRDDVAVQAYVARKAGVPLTAIALAHIDSSWVYPGGEDYRGLLVEEDLTAEAFARTREVEDWIAKAQAIAVRRKEPAIATGNQCSDPFECSFFGYCSSQEPQPGYPVTWLPRIQTKALRQLIEENNIRDMRDVPDNLLNPRQLRVKNHTLTKATFFDGKGAAKALEPHGFPAYFMDFETISFAVPIWKGTRPYQQIPFQFSVHKLSSGGKIEHKAFLDLTGNDPSRPFAEGIISACGDGGPVYVYNASFEASQAEGAWRSLYPAPSATHEHHRPTGRSPAHC